MIKALIIGVIVLAAAAFVSGQSYGQTSTTSPTMTPYPTSSSGSTVPTGAPSTGHAAY